MKKVKKKRERDLVNFFTSKFVFGPCATKTSSLSQLMSIAVVGAR